MKAMILAAGRGVRLRMFTDRIPKPMVEVGGVPVIERTLIRLLRMGADPIVVNAHHLADRLIDYLGDGSRWGGRILWSKEEALMNTGGGVRKALPLLGEEPFLAVNGDILWDMDLAPLVAAFDPQRMDALLGMVPNPEYAEGDFRLGPDGRLERGGGPGSMTYSGIQMLSPQMVARFPEEPFSLNLLYDQAQAEGRLFGLSLGGRWADMGTPERLEEAQKSWTS